RIRWSLLLEEKGDDLVAEVFPREIVAKECGHVDQQRVEQPRVLGRVRLDEGLVGAESLDADGAHPLGQAPDQPDPLVAAQIQPARLVQVLQQFSELAVAGLTIVGHGEAGGTTTRVVSSPQESCANEIMARVSIRSEPGTKVRKRTRITAGGVSHPYLDRCCPS